MKPDEPESPAGPFDPADRADRTRRGAAPADPARPPVLRPRWQRVLLTTAGGVALGVGIIGIFLPLVPTTPLVLLSAFLFAGGSKRAHAWLLGHRRFGPIVRQWEEHRSVPRRVQWISMVLVVITFALSGLLVVKSVPGRITLGAGGVALLVFLATLPTARRP